MTAQNGRDLLIKVDMDGSGAFETLAGLRASRISFNAQPVDITSIESEGGWRELLAGGGVRSASISGSGVFRDQDTDERARQIFFDGLRRCDGEPAPRRGCADVKWRSPYHGADAECVGRA